MENQTFTILKSPVLSRRRELIVCPEYIRFGDQHFKRQEVESYRFGLKWITGYQFTIGREYRIFVRSTNGKVIRISFRTFYGYKKEALHKQFVELLDALHNCYFSGMITNLLQEFDDGKTIHLCDTVIDKNGISIRVKRKQTQINWNDLGTKDYYTYYSVFSKTHPADICKHFDYMDDWNVALLWSVIRSIQLQAAD